MKFFKHSGPLPNPTRTDNHDNSDNVAQRSRPSSVHTHHQSDRPTAQDSQRRGSSVHTHHQSDRLTAQDSQRRGPRSPISIAAGDTPSAKLPGISAAAALRGARRGEGLKGEELLRHECGRPVERLVDAVAPSQAALEVGLPAQRRPW